MTITGSFVNPYPFFENIANSFFGISFKLDNSNAIALSSNLFWMGKQVLTFGGSPEYRDVLVNPFHWNLKLSYSHLISENFSAGISLGILQSNLSEMHTAFEQGEGIATTVLFDAGILLKDIISNATIQERSEEKNYAPLFKWLLDVGEENQNRGFSFGLQVSNLGHSITLIDAEQSDSPPSKLSFGVSYIPYSSAPINIMIGSDFEERLNENSFIDYIHLGGEVKIFKVLALRGGYLYGASDVLLSYPTFGFGITLKFISVNFANYNRSLESTWHFDSIISLEF